MDELRLEYIKSQGWRRTKESDALKSVVLPDERVIKGSDMARTQPC
jgi:hypothetical protein